MTLPRRHWLLLALAGVATPVGLALHRRLAPSAAAPSGLAPALPDELCIAAPTHPWDASSGLARHAARTVPAKARCPVCGMFPARHPRWAAQAIHGDGAAHFFDSPVDLFLYLQRVPAYAPGRQRAELAALYVTAHDTGTWLAATQAVYVHGSALRGPMRQADLPALASAMAAARLSTRHGGRALDFATLVQALPPDLRRLASHRHDDTHSAA